MNQTTQNPREDVEPVHDLAAAADLMRLAWKPPSWRYTPELLREYLGRPSVRPDMIVGVRREGRLAGFFAAIPFVAQRGASRDRGIFTSFLSVHPEVRNPSLSVRMLSRVVENARKAGFTHLYTVFHHDPNTNKLIAMMFKIAGIPATAIAEVRFFVRPNGVRRGTALPHCPGDLVAYQSSWRAQVSELLAAQAASLDLAQVYPEADIEHLFATSALTRTVLCVRDGRLHGLVAGRVRDLVAPKPRRDVHVDFVVTTGMDEDEGHAFLDHALVRLAPPDVDALVVPWSGQLDPGYLQSRGFLGMGGKAEFAYSALVPEAARVPRLPRAWFEVF
ncbi:MAG: hypothetical protein IT458_06620 [Planctomycetes bacterium]|nr:hypothetical protein [Planctomycetota bacterium]